MKKNILSVALLMMSGSIYAQVGIGTQNPNSSTLLDIEAQAGNFKGVLLPRIPLISVEDSSNITGKNTPESLLVYNTTDNKDLKPGYYYWFDSRWVRLITSTDDVISNLVSNEELAVNLEEGTLFVRDTKNNIVSVPLTDINVVTTLVEDGQGKYTYTSEDNTKTVIDVAADVINNITQIFNEESVTNEIIQSITQNAKELLGDEMIEVVGGQKAVLAETSLRLKDSSITPAKLKPGALKQLLITDENGQVKWVDATDTIIKEVVETNEVVTLLENNGNGTYSYYNENSIDASGNPIKANGIVIDANTLKITQTTEGTYVFSDGTFAQTGQPLATIDIQGTVIENISEILKDTIVQNDIYTTVAAQGKTITSSDNSLAIPANNKAALEDLNLTVATAGINSTHLAPKAVTEEKIATDKASGLVLTSNGEGGAEFKSLGEVVGNSGKEIEGSTSISVVGGEHAAISHVKLDVIDGGITEAKLATDAVSTAKIKDSSVTTTKLVGEGASQILGTDTTGTVKWMNADDENFKVIFNANEKITLLQDEGDGTFTYYNEKQVDNQGNVKPDAKGVNFDANTLSIDDSIEGVFVFRDKGNALPLATIDTRASSIIFENTDIHYTTVEEAITEIQQKIEVIEQIELSTAALAGKGILINGEQTVADAVLVPIELSIADEAVTVQKIKGGSTKQLLITNEVGKAQWVDATDSIIEEIVHAHEKTTILEDNHDGTFTYYSETDIERDGTLTGPGILFNANTLRIDSDETGKYVFYDKLTNTPLATINVEADVIEKITEILNETTVQEQIYTTVSAQAKAVTAGESITVVGGEKAVLNDMTIAVSDQGITTEKIKNQAVTEDKMFAGEGKENFIPVAQADGSVVYQAMGATLKGQPLTVDSSIDLIGDASKAVLQPINLKVKDEGIATAHLQNQAVTTDKIGTGNAAHGTVLTADGSGNAVFLSTDEAIEPAMNGDLKGAEGLIVEGGENVLFGDQGKTVVVKINDGGVKGKHIAATTITNTNIVDQTIQSSKLTAGEGVANRVALANENGEVTYQILSASTISEKGAILSDGTISISDGADKVLADVTLGINDTSIYAAKLNAGNAEPGAVATVGTDGVSVSYQPITAASIAAKGDIKTDGIVTVNNGADKVLADVELGIKEKGITSVQLADGAVQNAQLASKSVSADKISAAGIDAASVLLTNGDGEVIWGELGNIVGDVAGDLTTDGIIQMTKGDGTKTLLKDVTLGIADNSITSDKLSSTVSGTPKDIDYILVTDGKGGFDYVMKEAVQAGGVDLKLGTALEFINGSDGLNAVLAKTSMDVKAGGISTEKLANAAVTTAKMSSAGATANTVLTADGLGNVSYKKLNESVFEGTEADLKSDGSLLIPANNKAVLKETTIGIADLGVDTKHIKANAVTNDKISSKVGGANVASGTILTADGNGNTRFQSLDLVATQQGKALTSTDGSLTIPTNQAVLQNLNISVANQGIKDNHIANRNVTADKIGTGDNESGLVLTSNGQGGAEFKTLSDALTASGKALQEGTGIAITGAGANQALLKDATVSIANGGVGATQLANNAVTADKILDKNVTTAKISSKVGTANASQGFALIADGSGGVSFQGVNSTSGELKGSTAITITNGANALLKDATVTVKNKGITNAMLADTSVTVDKMSSVVGGTNAASGMILTANGQGKAEYKEAALMTSPDESLAIVGDGKVVLKKTEIKINNLGVKAEHIANNAVTNAKIIGNAVTTAKIANKTVTGAKIADNTIETLQLADKAVTNEKIANNAIVEAKISNNAVTTAKMSSNVNGTNQAEGLVLTSDGKGGVSYKETSASGPSGPSFFYSPTFPVIAQPGTTGVTINVYDSYSKQFSGSDIKKSDANSSLHVYAANELNFFVVYYDKDVFSNVSINAAGVLQYDVKSTAVVTGSSFFNVVMQLK